MDVVCVVLNCYDMFERSQNIIENCFERYAYEIIPADMKFIYKGKPCALNEECALIVERNKPLQFEIAAPDNDGDRNAVAKLEILCENELLFSHNLYTIK